MYVRVYGVPNLNEIKSNAILAHWETKVMRGNSIENMQAYLLSGFKKKYKIWQFLLTWTGSSADLSIQIN